MDLGSLIFGILTLACFIVPVVYLQRVKGAEKKKFIKAFKSLTEQHQLQVSACDFWNHGYVIGLDDRKHKLFYWKNKEGKEDQSMIDLAQVAACRLVNVHRTIDGSRIIDRVELVFSFHNARLGEKVLKIYDKEESISVNDELELANKWIGIINAELEKLKAVAVKPVESKRETLPAA